MDSQDSGCNTHISGPFAVFPAEDSYTVAHLEFHRGKHHHYKPVDKPLPLSSASVQIFCGVLGTMAGEAFASSATCSSLSPQDLH